MAQVSTRTVDADKVRDLENQILRMKALSKALERALDADDDDDSSSEVSWLACILQETLAAAEGCFDGMFIAKGAAAKAGA